MTDVKECAQWARIKWFCTALTFMAIWGICSAEPVGAAPAPGASDPDALVTLNMRDADIRSVIQWIAEQTHKQIVIDPRVQGRVSVLADRPMTIKQAYQVFLALLGVHGFSTSDTDGVLRIYPSALAKTSPREVVDDFGGMASQGQVLHVMAVHNVSAASLAELIKPLVSASGYVAPIIETNNLILADDGDNVKRLVELVQRMDQSGSLAIDVVKLQHANARDAAQVLATLGSAGAAGDSGGANASPLSVAADERSNSVLLAGDPTTRKRARDLLRELDQPVDKSSNNTRVVYLHYLSAAELLPVLKSMTTNEQKDAKDATTKASSVTIEASKSNNALVLSGAAGLLDKMQDVIAKLDVRRAQVLVEAVIVELSSDVSDQLGVQWATDFKSTGAQAGTNFGLGPTTTIDPTNPSASLPTGLSVGYFQGGNLRALLNALASTNKANVLSTPSVMTLDNQEAQIIVGSNIPIITGQSTATSTTTTPFTTFERRDIGVTLKITPQINEGDAVTLAITQEVQTVANTASDTALAGVKDIVTNKRSVTTKVLVHDDTTVVLGGLISDERQDIANKVPVLGDLPLVGGLFRSTTHKITKQNLMVFIHPTIVDIAAVAESISRRNYDAMQVQQLQYHGGKFETADKPQLPEYEEFLPKRKGADPAAAQAASPAPASQPSSPEH